MADYSSECSGPGLYPAIPTRGLFHRTTKLHPWIIVMTLIDCQYWYYRRNANLA